MSVDKIVDYVVKTPHNTNPNVIRSLVKGTVDENTLALAKAYSDSKGGYIGPGKFVLESSVVNHGDESEPKLLPFVELIPGEKYIVTVSAGKDSVSFECEAKEVRETGTRAVYLGNMVWAGLDDTGELFGVIAMKMGDETGTALFWYRQTDVTIRVEQAETVVPIYPKYLPKGGFGYTTEGDINLIEEQTVTAGTTDDEGRLWIWLSKEIGFEDWWVPELELGKEYTVTVNGKVYKSVAKELKDGYYYLGDVREYDYLGLNLLESDIVEANVEHTGEPWCVIWQLGIDSAFLMFDGTTDVTLSITYRGEVAVPIDSKFLPENVGMTTLTFADIFDEDADGLSQTMAKMFAGGTKFYPHVFTRSVFWDELKPGKPVCVVSDDSMMRYQLVDTAPRIVFDKYNKAAQLVISFDVVYGETLESMTTYSMRITLLRTDSVADMMYVEIAQGSSTQTAINLNEYGLDITELLFSGGGTAKFTGNNLAEMWETINRESNFVFTYTFAGATISFPPISRVSSDGKVGNVSAKFMAQYESMVMDVSIMLGAHIGDEGYNDGVNVTAMVNFMD